MYTIQGKISHIKNIQKYKACLECKKKLLIISDEEFRCEHCKQSLRTYNLRVILNVLVFDQSGNLWMTIFQEKLEQLFGSKFNNEFLSDDAKFDKWSETLLHKNYKICVKSTIQKFNNQDILKNICYSIKLLNE